MIITHDKVLIQLDEHADHTLTESGVYLPKFLNIETDGGRPDVRTSNEKYVASGTVVDASPLALSKMADAKTPLSIGDKVFVSQTAVSQSFHFKSKRDALQYDFDGLILVPYILIEAIIN